MRGAGRDNTQQTPVVSTSALATPRPGCWVNLRIGRIYYMQLHLDMDRCLAHTIASRAHPDASLGLVEGRIQSDTSIFICRVFTMSREEPRQESATSDRSGQAYVGISWTVGSHPASLACAAAQSVCSAPVTSDAAEETRRVVGAGRRLRN